MKAYLSNKNGKFKINKLEFEQAKIVVEWLREYELHLETLSATLQRERYYKDWSMCHLMRHDLFVKLNKITIAEYYSLNYHLHELFVFHAMLMRMQKAGNDYEKTIARQLVMLINPNLPRTETTTELEIYSKI